MKFSIKYLPWPIPRPLDSEVVIPFPADPLLPPCPDYLGVRETGRKLDSGKESVESRGEASAQHLASGPPRAHHEPSRPPQRPAWGAQPWAPTSPHSPHSKHRGPAGVFSESANQTWTSLYLSRPTPCGECGSDSVTPRTNRTGMHRCSSGPLSRSLNPALHPTQPLPLQELPTAFLTGRASPYSATSALWFPPSQCPDLPVNVSPPFKAWLPRAPSTSLPSRSWADGSPRLPPHFCSRGLCLPHLSLPQMWSMRPQGPCTTWPLGLHRGSPENLPSRKGVPVRVHGHAPLLPELAAPPATLPPPESGGPAGTNPGRNRKEDRENRPTIFFKSQDRQRKAGEWLTASTPLQGPAGLKHPERPQYNVQVTAKPS